MHREAVDAHRRGLRARPTCSTAAREVWDEASTLGREHGFRNAQVTVLAPTGTIGFMMDCDTTGVEPDIALVKYKKLVGGGMLKIVNHTVPRGAASGSATRRAQVAEHPRVHRRERHDRGRARPEGRAPAGLRLRLQARARASARIHYMGHVRMMARGAALPLRRHLQDGQHAAATPPSRTSMRRLHARPGSWASRPWPSTATAASASSR